MVATGIRVGTAGWSYADWEGVVYPTRKPPGFHPLRHLARSIDCMELNSSFYRMPSAPYAERWVDCIADRPGFVFVAKLHRAFTHDAPRSASIMEADVAEWRAGIAPLERAGRLSAVLAQFPHSFTAGPRAWGRIEWLARHFGDLRMVLELRHASWFEPEALGRIEALGAALAQIDLPFAESHPPETFPAFGELGYLRLHGRNGTAWFDPKAGRDDKYDWLYDQSEVASIVQRAKELARQHEQTFVVANNHFAGKALVNALEIRAALEEVLPVAPAELVRTYPRLADRVRVEDAQDGVQGKLFE